MKLKLSMYYFVFFLAAGAYYPFMSLYLQKAGFSGSEIGLIYATGSLTAIFTQPFIGLISDAAKDYRSLIKLSIIFTAIVINGYLLSDSILPILLTQILMALLSAPLMPIVDAIAVDQAPKYGYTYGQVRLWGAASWTLVTFSAGWVYKQIGFDYIFPMYSILSIALLIIVFKFPNVQREKQHRSQMKQGIRALITNRRFIWFTFLGMINAVLIAINSAFLPIYYERLGYPLEFVGWNFGMAALIEIPMFILVAKLVKKHNLMLFMISGVFVFALKYFLMGFAPPAWLLIGLQLLDGIGFVLTISAVMEIVNLLSPDNVKATAQTLFGSIAGIAGLAGIFGNLIGGFMMDHQGPQFLFWTMGGVGFALTLLFILFPNKQSFRMQQSEG